MGLGEFLAWMGIIVAAGSTFIGTLMAIIWKLLNDKIKESSSLIYNSIDKIAIIDGELNGKEGLYVRIASIEKDIEAIQKEGKNA